MMQATMAAVNAGVVADPRAAAAKAKPKAKAQSMALVAQPAASSVNTLALPAGVGWFRGVPKSVVDVVCRPRSLTPFLGNPLIPYVEAALVEAYRETVPGDCL